jgi:hypothetical protein
MEREEVKWRQKSRDLWLRKGDRNSKFFHLFTIIRGRRNFFAEIKLNNGQWIQSREEIERYFKENFLEVYHSSIPDISPELDDLFSPCITAEENMELSCVPSPQEIKDVIWDMHPLKAPGPDGFLELFFKQYWSMVGPQVVLAIQFFFFAEGWMLPQVNHTFITLIPKKVGACNFNQFRLISLCNFYYKVIPKIIVNRIRPILSKVIDPTQAAFVPHRWITKNVVLAQEVVHNFKKKKRNYGLVGLKIDFHKAYGVYNPGLTSCGF